MTVRLRMRTCRCAPALALPLVLVFSAACMPKELPGEPVGTYRVTGLLKQNSCGSTAVPAEDPLRFEVQILDDEGSGVWALSEQPFVYGTLTDEGDFSFKQETSYALEQKRPDPATLDEAEILSLLTPETESQPSPCVLVQVETVEGNLTRRADDEGPDAGQDGDRSGDDEQTDLEGENRIEIHPAPGSNCSRATSAQGGVFVTLPCEIRYTLQGQLQ